ncbi:hypothetical protein [Streptomyces sp. 150FB]|uniref:hypothetical protein n=1 Tax=Streptomyces sp. 150FB TaxID=1576605 RepID=UPI000A8C1D47|nr:hypothetical protein [Streptomyces sp. 150FB]
MDFGMNTGALPGSDPGRTVEGDFETCLTVRADPPGTRVPLAAWATAHGLTLTHVVLDRGRTPSRPTLVVRGSGGLDEHRGATAEWSARLAHAGFTVVRAKISAAPWNDGVPATDADAAAFPAHCHFEHRITVRLPIPYDARRLTVVAQRHTAHVSRDARRVLPGGIQERRVRQHAHGVGRPGARALLEELLAALSAAGFQPADVEEQFVVHDDNPALDSGWIEERES